jgi:hypothetical protein
VDVDPQRLAIVGGFAQRMVTAYGAPFRIKLTTDRRAGVTGASYVTTQLRVGGMLARRNDEYLGKRHGLIGQETTGVGGLAKALRTIPVVLDIAADMAELAPGRAAGQLHQSGRPGDRGAEPLRARHAGHRRLQRAHHRQDEHSGPACSGTPARPSRRSEPN